MRNCVKCYRPTGTKWVEWVRGGLGNLIGSFSAGKKIEDDGVVCESCWKDFLSGHPVTQPIGKYSGTIEIDGQIVAIRDGLVVARL